MLVFAAVPAIGLALFLAPGRTGQLGIGLMASGIAYWFGLFGSLALFFPLTLVPVIFLLTIGLLLYALPVLACDAIRKVSDLS